MQPQQPRRDHFHNHTSAHLRNLRTLCALCVFTSAWLWAGCEVSESGGNGSITEEDSTSGSDSTSGTTADGGDTSGGVCLPAEDPARSCYDTGCPSGETCKPIDSTGCRPSACGCDEASGEWICTADCGQPVACVPDSACGAAAPALSCLDMGCPEGEACVPSGDDGCRPSSCSCDEASGGWTCTDDCQPLMHCAPSSACDAPSPALSCEDTGCPRGEVCAPSGDAACRPSACSCDASLGTWSCTDDCQPMMACSVPGTDCAGPNPAINCEDTGCADGQLCVLSGDDGCTPSACSCDATTGSWLCTRDCGPVMECQASACGAYPTTCDMIDGLFACGEGMVCDPQPWDAPPPCCTCDPAVGSWQCTDNCMQVTGCKVAPAPAQCVGEDPSIDCADTGCPDGQACVPSDADVCVPSACGCDESTGDWICTADCGQAMVCAPTNGRACNAPNPAIDCADTGCPDGQACMISPLTVCVPSSCACDEVTGEWVCTDDCDHPMVCGVP
jgi:hypothetical protein